MEKPNPNRLVNTPFDPSKNTSPIPCAREGMSMGSVMTTATTPLPRMFVRQSTHDITSASGTEMAVAASATPNEFIHAAAKRSLPNTDWASGLNRPANIPSRGRTAANKKNRNSAARTTVILPKARISTYLPMKRARESILMRRLRTTNSDT
ncbi:hypothetical protein CE91St33_09930 [Eggerthella lenta]|nr:hypothetical protein CE91St33_09930 [Eggerthella lenta]